MIADPPSPASTQASRLTGKTVIVTGAGSQGGGVGNGQSIALLLAAQGAGVLCVDVQHSRADEVAQAIRAAGGRAESFCADVSDPAATVAMVAKAVSAFGSLQGIVCNVGIAGGGSLADVDLTEWNRVLQVNLTATMLCAHAAAPELIASGGGSIVTVGSTAGMRWYSPGTMAYATSKSALTGLTMSIAGELGPARVRANMVAIGQVWSPMVAAGAAHMPPDWRERRARSGLIPDEGTPQDVANAVAFLISDESRWITGHTLLVDAGASLTMRH
jgi:NAD(P)-dependent dehydrogenase (short-subunit alcohol dehydrogenase family)